MKKMKESTVTTIISIVVVLAIVGFFVFLTIKKVSPDVPEIIREDYNGFEFYQDVNGFWHTELRTVQGDQDVPFRHHPSEVDNLNYDPRITKRLAQVQGNKGSVVITFDSNLFNPNLTDVGAPAIAGVEIGKITSKIFGMPTSSAITTPIEGADNLPVVDCLSSNTALFVFEFRLAEKGQTSKIFSENFCGIIRANSLNDTIKLADLAVFKLVGIIPE